MYIEIKSELEQFIQAQLASGRFASADDVINEALILLLEREQRIEELREKIAVGTEKMSQGEITDTNFQPPLHEFNGLRVKLPGHPAVYLVDGGYRRWIPNPETYNNLFRDWNNIIDEMTVANIPIGSNISDGAVLAKSYDDAAVFLVDQGKKRLITSPEAMDKYYFSWKRVYQIPNILLDSISTGLSISA